MSGATISSTSSPDAVRSSSRIRRTRRNERRHGASQPTAAAATVSIPMAPDTNKQESEQELHSDETKLTWDDFFQLLLAFKLEHHHLRIPCDYVTTTPQQIQVRLGQWARYHRSAQFRAREDTSSRDKRDRLKAIGFPFSLREQSWNALFKQLLDFKAKNLHVEMRRNYITPDGVKLGNWLAKQRILLQKPCTNTASWNRNQQRIRRLNEIGMIWNKKSHDDKYRSWYAYYNLLPAYLAEKQHLWIPCDYKTADGVPLGIWAKQQRYKRARKDKTRQAQVMLLDEIGFLWTPLREENKKPERHLFTFTCIDGGTSTWRDEMGGRFRVAGYVSLPS